MSSSDHDRNSMLQGKVLVTDWSDITTRVYLVEDHVLIRETLRARMEHEENIEFVGESGTAERALSELDSLIVDVVVMDIRLPGMDGIEATRQLKQRHKDLAVLILTGYEDEHVETAIEAGASGYILKTSSADQLMKAVRVVHQGMASLDPSLTDRLFQQVTQLRRSNRRLLLTDRQVEILQLMGSGVRYKDIATDLFVSETTVNREARAIFDVLGVNDAAHAVSEAHKRGFL